MSSLCRTANVRLQKLFCLQLRKPRAFIKQVIKKKKISDLQLTLSRKEQYTERALVRGAASERIRAKDDAGALLIAGVNLVL